MESPRVDHAIIVEAETGKVHEITAGATADALQYEIFGRKVVMNEMVEEMNEIVRKNPFAQHIGMELLEVTEGYALGRIRLAKQYENIYGGMHGGCAYSLADTLSGIAASTYGEYVTTLDASMNYLLPVEHTEYVYCKAKVLRHGRKITVVRVELLNDEQTLLIDGSFTFYNIGKRNEK